MSLVEQIHAERKARLARMGVRSEAPRIAPIKRSYVPVKPRAGLKPIDPTPWYRHMWFWQLLNVPTSSDGYRPTVKRIMQVVAKHYGVNVSDIIGPRRTADLVFPRQLTMYLSRQMTLLSLPQIGSLVGGRDHTTVLHGCRQIERYRSKYPDLEFVIEKLKREMGAII